MLDRAPAGARIAVLAGLSVASCFAAGCGGATGDKESHTNAASAGGRPTAQVAEAVPKPKLSRKELRRAQRAKMNSTGTLWRELTFFVPDTIDGFRARTISEGRDIELGAAGAVVSIRRAYAQGDVWLELELLDTADSERVRNVFNRARDVTRDSARAVIRPLRVKNHKALTQWLAASKVARTSVLVSDRFLVNVSVKPADSPAPSIALADKLDWAAVEKLAAADGGNEPAPEPIETSARKPASARRAKPAAAARAAAVPASSPQAPPQPASPAAQAPATENGEGPTAAEAVDDSSGAQSDKP
jgi:hypothetical protein